MQKNVDQYQKRVQAGFTVLFYICHKTNNTLMTVQICYSLDVYLALFVTH